MNKGLFMDRDGVINIDYGYVHKTKDFEFIDGVFEFTLEAIKKKYLIFIITNQAGIGRGFYSINDFNKLTDWMNKKFLDNGVLINKVYFSPYHPIEGKGDYRKDHISRKPRPGMIEQAKKEFDIDLSKSVLIGDKLTDIEAGDNAGIPTKILLTERNKVNINSDLDYTSVDSLYHAKKYL